MDKQTTFALMKPLMQESASPQVVRGEAHRERERELPGTTYQRCWQLFGNMDGSMCGGPHLALRNAV